MLIEVKIEVTNGQMSSSCRVLMSQSPTFDFERHQGSERSVVLVECSDVGWLSRCRAEFCSRLLLSGVASSASSGKHILCQPFRDHRRASGLIVISDISYH